MEFVVTVKKVQNKGNKIIVTDSQDEQYTFVKGAVKECRYFTGARFTFNKLINPIKSMWHPEWFRGSSLSERHEYICSFLLKIRDHNLFIDNDGGLLDSGSVPHKMENYQCALDGLRSIVSRMGTTKHKVAKEMAQNIRDKLFILGDVYFGIRWLHRSLHKAIKYSNLPTCEKLNKDLSKVIGYANTFYRNYSNKRYEVDSIALSGTSTIAVTFKNGVQWLLEEDIKVQPQLSHDYCPEKTLFKKLSMESIRLSPEKIADRRLAAGLEHVQETMTLNYEAASQLKVGDVLGSLKATS